MRGKAIKARICGETVAAALQRVGKCVCGPSSLDVSAVHPKTLSTSINTDLGRRSGQITKNPSKRDTTRQEGDRDGPLLKTVSGANTC